VGLGGLRWAADDGVATRWGRVGDTELPAPGTAWQLDLDGSAEVAHRPAHVVVARRGDGPVRARFYVDDASGLLVRRDVLQRDGDLERSVRFTRLATDDITPAVPPVPEGGPKAVPTHDVGDEYVVPDRLEPGFRLMGRYEHPSGAVQLFYSDGLFSLSLFEQPGAVDWAALPEGGRRATAGSERAQWYATDAGTVVVWSRAGLVLTGVSDAPRDTVRTAVSGVKGEGGGLVDDIVDFVLEPFDWD
jgi:sigma-E factor negative regulatory protein RseB